MPSLHLLLFRSHQLVSSASPAYVSFVRDPEALGAKRTYQYRTIPNVSKGIEPHIALRSYIGPEHAQSPPDEWTGVASPPPKPTTSTGDPGPRASPSTLDYHGHADSQSSPSAIVPGVDSRPAPSARAAEGNGANDDSSQGGGENPTLNSWTNDDVDATDFKNMPDYDPDQEESVYDSTPEPQTESTASPTKEPSSEDISYVQRYVKLSSDDPSSEGEISAPTANFLLLLFIPGPLEPPTSSSPPSSPEPPRQGRRHADFLHHFSRYPYLTSHDNYIRHTGYVLESAHRNAPAEYLIVQEFSELGRRGERKVSLDWELKRTEAKHWWRKEERGAVGVRVGFFKLANEEIVGQSTYGEGLEEGSL